MHEAMYYENKDSGVRCLLCPQFCRLKEGETGLCGVRKERDGKFYTLNYSVCAAMAIDPVEKKPLYHFFPGREIFSVGTVGCNLGCGFCQNWHLARQTAGLETTRLEPAQLVSLLEKYRDKNPVGLAYTYSEPGMWFEYVLDAARLVREKGYKNVLVTNGFLNEEPLKELLPWIDAFNIDVKAFRDDYYREHCAGRLDPVLRYVETAARDTHVELTYLVVPTLNDSEEDIRRFTDWVADINPAIPVHFSRYFPQHRFTLPPTPVGVMEAVRKIASEKLHYVYLGNLPGSDAAHTYCPECGELLVHRSGYRIENRLQGNACPRCKSAAGFIS
ncbi:MAG: AmmeMemoRadiSam system radical SAM enzyme [Bacillota bacterium]|nr:AmmeMemoRadiSam system radical SAM enzyme [Bacillota bacterium]MDW7684531.1 AmmeMemoRadiSam system radical SAM enzyme [Bacillota bacterium]